MKKDNIINVKVRMNLEREEDRTAWENLRHLDRKKYKSYSRAFIKALNYFTEREQRINADPTPERRKAQEELLMMIAGVVHSSVHSALASMPVIQQVQTYLSEAKEIPDKSPTAIAEVSSQEKAALMDEALDFVNGF